MAWQVALVLDTETHVSALLGMMPVWAQTSPKRKEAASQLRASWDEAWSPDPAFTLWTNPPSEDLIDEVFAEIPTVEMHHPELACLRIFGLIETERLTEALKEFGYRPVAGTTFPALAFARFCRRTT